MPESEKKELRFDDLKLFREIATRLNGSGVSLRDAAIAVGVSFSHVSNTLKRLEGSLPQKGGSVNSRLVNRPKSGKATLTKRGKVLFKHTVRLLVTFEAIRRGRSVKRKEVLRVGAPNMFGTHMMPRAVHAFLVANSSRHFDVRILESRELSDGIRLLQHNAIDCLIECTDSKLEFENLKATPLPCSFEHVFLVHQGRFPEIANRPGEFLSLTELSEVPIAHAITRVLSPILYLSGITRLELPTFEAVRRHAEQGDAIGLMFNWAPSLGIPDGLTTAEEMRRHLLKWQLVPKFVSPEGKDHLMKKVMRTYMVTSTLDVVTSSMQRLLKEVSQQCEHIQRNQRLLPQTYTPNKSRATPKRRASKHQ